MLIHYVIGGLVGFAVCLTLLLIYSLCYASGKAARAEEDEYGGEDRDMERT